MRTRLHVVVRVIGGSGFFFFSLDCLDCDGWVGVVLLAGFSWCWLEAGGGRFGLLLLEQIWVFLGTIPWSFLGRVTLMVVVGFPGWDVACNARSESSWGEYGFSDLVASVSQGCTTAVGGAPLVDA